MLFSRLLHRGAPRQGAHLHKRSSISAHSYAGGFNGPPSVRGAGRSPGGSGASARLAGTTYSTGVPEIGVDSGVDRPRICILGGGFGGLYTAVRLEGLMWPQGRRPSITLIDQNDRFVFKPMLYELLSDSVNEWEVAPEYSALLAPYAVRHVQSRVTKVRPESRTQDGGSVGGGAVVLEGGVEVPYDWLVLALGAETNTAMAEGAKQHAVAFATLEDAKRVKVAVECIERRAITRPATISVVGAGYAGVEVAAMLAERLGKAAAIQIVTPSNAIMEGAAPGLVHAAQEQLSRLGVTLKLGTLVTQIKASGEPWPDCPDLGKLMEVKLPDGSTGSERSDLVIWTAGQVPAAKAQGAARDEFPFPTTAKGFTETDPTLRVVGHQQVFAIGDAATLAAASEGTAPFPSTAQVAFQQADYVAWNLWAAINKRPLLTFRYQNLGTMMSLGKASGAVALNVPVPQGLASSIKASPLGGLFSVAGVDLDNTDGGLTVKGPLAGVMRRAAYWYRQPTDDHRIKVGASWLQGGTTEMEKLLNRLSPANRSA